MQKTDFIRYFGSEHIQGTIHMFTKKLLDGVKQVPVDFNFMPCDHLYPINTTTEEYKASKQRMMQQPKEATNRSKFFKDTLGERLRSKVRAEVERATLGMTIGFKMEGMVEMILEAPLEKEKTFIIMNSLQIQEDGAQTYIRKILEIIGGKKLRNMLHQKFLIKRIHDDCAIKPNFVPIGNDILAHKRAKISNFLND